MALKCNNRTARLPSAPDENPHRPAYALPSCFSLLLPVAAYSSRPPTAQIESAFPIKNATKQIPNTEWSSEAPKYCHVGAPAPGKSEANNNVTINSNPNALA